MEKKDVCRSAWFTGTTPRAWLLLLMLLCCSCGFTQTVGAARMNQGSKCGPQITPELLLDARKRASKRASVPASCPSSKNVSTPQGLQVPSVSEPAARTPTARVTPRQQVECASNCTRPRRQVGAPSAPVGEKSDRHADSSSIATFPGVDPSPRLSLTQDTGKLPNPPVTKAVVLLRPPDNVDAAPCLRRPPAPPVKTWKQKHAGPRLRRGSPRLELLARERPAGWLERVSLFCGDVELDSYHSGGKAPLKQWGEAVLGEVERVSYRGTPFPNAGSACGKAIQNPGTTQQRAVELERESHSPLEQQKSVHKQQLQMPTKTSENTLSEEKYPLQRPTAASKTSSSSHRGGRVSPVEPIYDDVCECPETTGQSEAQQNSSRRVPQEQQRSGKGKLKETTEQQGATSKKQMSALQRLAAAFGKLSVPPGGNHAPHDDVIYVNVCGSPDTPRQSEVQQNSRGRVPQKQQRSGKGNLEATTEEKNATPKKGQFPLQRLAQTSNKCSSPPANSHLSPPEPIYDEVCTDTP